LIFGIKKPPTFYLTAAVGVSGKSLAQYGFDFIRLSAPLYYFLLDVCVWMWYYV